MAQTHFCLKTVSEKKKQNTTAVLKQVVWILQWRPYFLKVTEENHETHQENSEGLIRKVCPFACLPTYRPISIVQSPSAVCRQNRWDWLLPQDKLGTRQHGIWECLKMNLHSSHSATNRQYSLTFYNYLYSYVTVSICCVPSTFFQRSAC